MTPPAPDWTRVAAAIADEMRSRGVTKQELIDSSGVSFKTISRLLDGEVVVRADVKRKIAAAFGWPPDSLDRIAAGESLKDATSIGAVAAGVMGGLTAAADVTVFAPSVDDGLQLAASGVDLAELQRVDPDAYELIVVQARAALDRARRRKEGQ